MLKTIGLVLAAAIFLSCGSSKVNNVNQAANTLSDQEKNDGWKLLFDGTSTNGWHTYGSNTVEKAWDVNDGSIHLDAANRKDWPRNQSNDILTAEGYSNFHFKADWKIATNGNSGIIFYVKEDKAKYQNTYNTGLEMQVLDNAGHPDAKIIKHRAGDLYDLISSSSEPVKPANEWNHVEIVSNNGKLDFYLNGEHIINTTLWNDNWRQLVANSKFKSMPDFGTFKTGRIALQEHGEEVWFRNIKIKQL